MLIYTLASHRLLLRSCKPLSPGNLSLSKFMPCQLNLHSRHVLVYVWLSCGPKMAAAWKVASLHGS